MFVLGLDGEEDPRWRRRARCRDGTGGLTELFFSEEPDDIEWAKALCAECPVRVPCLAGALARREPGGVWGGQLVVRGRVRARPPRRGRPPLPRDPRTGEVVRDPARVDALRARQREAEQAAQAEAEREAAEARSLAEGTARAEGTAAGEARTQSAEAIARSA